jgi:hypothetical protein
VATNILMPALSPVARLDRAIHPAHVHAPKELYAHLGGPLLRAMTIGGVE